MCSLRDGQSLHFGEPGQRLPCMVRLPLNLRLILGRGLPNLCFIVLVTATLSETNVVDDSPCFFYRLRLGREFESICHAKVSVGYETESATTKMRTISTGSGLAAAISGTISPRLAGGLGSPACTQ